MLLALDVGNTNITLGFYNGEQLTAKSRLPTKRDASPDEYGRALLRAVREAGVKPEAIGAVAIVSVVPELKGALNQGTRASFGREPYWVDGGSETGLTIEPGRLHDLGADRLADMAAGHHDYSGPLLIIDFGTATTYDVLTEEGVSLGGAISPGIKISAEALWEKAAQLPRFEIEKPDSILAKSTLDSMRSGLVFGYIGQVEYFVREIKKLIGTEITVIATGGLSALFKGSTDAIDIYDDDLTLKGVKYLYERNHSPE